MTYYQRNLSFTPNATYNGDKMQVELISSDIEAMVEFKYIVTLQQDLLSSEVMITNLKSSNLHLMGSVVTHLTVSTPDATYAIGLQGSNYFSKPPLMSDFSIIPPDFGQKRLPGSRQPWATTLQGLLLSWDNQVDKDSRGKIGEQDNEGESEGEEDDNYAHLTDKMSRIYTSTPRRFTVIDRVMTPYSNLLSNKILLTHTTPFFE